MAKCIECGLLALRSNATRLLIEANDEFREIGKPHDRLDAFSYPLCSQKVIEIQQLAMSLPESVWGRDKRVLEIINEERDCAEYIPWRMGYSPREHLQLKIQESLAQSNIDDGRTPREWERVLSTPTNVGVALEVFFSYSHRDKELRNDLDDHLSVLKRLGAIKAWHDGMIHPGQELEEEIFTHLDTSQIILLLISSSFMASDFCFNQEMIRAINRHNAGTARVIPIILRPVDNWQATQFGKLKALPADGRPVTSWLNRDEAFADVARGIGEAVRELIEGKTEIPFEKIQPINTATPHGVRHSGSLSSLYLPGPNSSERVEYVQFSTEGRSARVINTIKRPQALRFIKPQELTVRTTDLPAEVTCADGKLIIKWFNDDGFAFEEQKTIGVEVQAEVYYELNLGSANEPSTQSAQIVDTVEVTGTRLPPELRRTVNLTPSSPSPERSDLNDSTSTDSDSQIENTLWGPEEIDILKLLASSKTPTNADLVARELRIHHERAQYYLDSLKEKRYVAYSVADYDGTPAGYSLTANGRAYLVRSGLI